MKNYFKILNTENNRKLGLSFHYSDERPPENVDFKEMQTLNGMEYHAETPIKVINELKAARAANSIGRGYRLILDYGDTKTGKSWGETNDIEGYIGRSTGSKKIPLLLHNSRSHGGGAILDNCIVRIRTARGKRLLYSHPDFHE